MAEASVLIPYKKEALAPSKDPRIGLAKGIQYYLNSCYLDSSFMLLFYLHSRFDPVFNDKAHHRFSPAIRRIVVCLRRNRRFCPHEVSMELRRALQEVFGTTVCGDFMDIDLFLQKLFSSMELPPFIRYGSRAKSYSHSVFLITPPGQSVLPENCFVQTLLDASLGTQSLTFELPPSPALLIKMPYSGGRLQGMKYVVPSLDLNLKISNQLGEHEFAYTLTGVACLASQHYTAYLRDFEEYSPEWYHYNSKSGIDMSEVVPSYGLEEELKLVQRDPRMLAELYETSPIFHSVCSTAIYCVYVPKNVESVNRMIQRIETLLPKPESPEERPKVISEEVRVEGPPGAIETKSLIIRSHETKSPLLQEPKGTAAGLQTGGTKYSCPPSTNTRDHEQKTQIHGNTKHYSSSAGFVSPKSASKALPSPAKPNWHKGPARQWLEDQYEILLKNPLPIGDAAPSSDKNIFEWTALIEGPKGSPYEGGAFKVALSFSRENPKLPPIVKFITRIYHLNFDEWNKVNLSSLCPNAGATMTVQNVIVEIHNLLKTPNTSKPLKDFMRTQYLYNKDAYLGEAKKMRKSHALKPPSQGSGLRDMLKSFFPGNF